jgi:hypothetical protein
VKFCTEVLFVGQQRQTVTVRKFEVIFDKLNLEMCIDDEDGGGGGGGGGGNNNTRDGTLHAPCLELQAIN